MFNDIIKKSKHPKCIYGNRFKDCPNYEKGFELIDFNSMICCFYEVGYCVIEDYKHIMRKV